MVVFNYSIHYLSAALFDYEQAVIWYKEKSLPAAKKFVNAVDNRLNNLKEHPKRYRKTYKEFYEVTISGFPYNIVYTVDDLKQQVMVVAIYHQKRNPRSKFTRI